MTSLSLLAGRAVTQLMFWLKYNGNIYFSSGFCEACGGQIRDFPGVLRSPDNDGDGLYENSLSCYWTIIADEDHVVEFSIYELDLQPDCMDFIFLRVSNKTEQQKKNTTKNERKGERYVLLVLHLNQI